MNRRLLFPLVTIVGTPVLALLVAELLLSATGYPTTYEREDPFLGFRSITPLFEDRPSAAPGGQIVYATRDSKLPWFNHQEFRTRKPANGYRVFSFGGSTTFGRPYGYETAFSNWLRILMSAEDPSTYYEVVNVGGVSYASYRIINLMREMFEYEPDLFVVYTGHNEFLEERTYSNILEEPPAVTRLRTGLHRSRSYSLARSLWLDVRGREEQAAEEKFQMSGEVTAILDQSFGLEQYRRDPAREEAVLRHFRLNLEKMVDLTEDHDVRLIFVVPPSNEGGFSPFKSQLCGSLPPGALSQWYQLYDAGRAGLARGDNEGAADVLRGAADLDSCHADLRYRLGGALFALGRYDEAKRELVQARDLDVAPLRATSRIQETVREVAASRGVPVVDLVALLEARVQGTSSHSILGNETFLDHAHPTIAVHQALAEVLNRSVLELRGIAPERPLAPARVSALYDSVMAGLDPSYYATRDLNLAKVLSWLGKDEEAAPFVARAAAAMPDHPEAQYLRGVFLQNAGRYELAEQAYARAIALDSTFARAHIALGSLYERTGQLDRAVTSVRRALRYEPESDQAHFSLGNALYGTGRVEEAVEAYDRALALNPRHSRALNNLAAVYISTGRYEEAIEALERALALEPDNVNAYKNLGLSHYNEGRSSQARTMFETVLQIRPDDEFALRWVERLNEEARE